MKGKKKDKIFENEKNTFRDLYRKNKDKITERLLYLCSTDNPISDYFYDLGFWYQFYLYHSNSSSKSSSSVQYEEAIKMDNFYDENKRLRAFYYRARLDSYPFNRNKEYLRKLEFIVTFFESGSEIVGGRLKEVEEKLGIKTESVKVGDQVEIPHLISLVDQQSEQPATLISSIDFWEDEKITDSDDFIARCLFERSFYTIKDFNFVDKNKEEYNDILDEAKGIINEALNYKSNFNNNFLATLILDFKTDKTKEDLDMLFIKFEACISHFVSPPKKLLDFIDLRKSFYKLQENNVSSLEVNSNDDLSLINPSNNKNESSEVKAINNFDLAKEKEEEEDFDSAIKFYTKSIQFYDYYPSFMNRGIQNLRRNNIDLAIEDFSDVIRIKPDYHVAYYHRAKAFLLEKNIESAKSDFEKVIELKPNNRLAKIELEKIS